MYSVILIDDEYMIKQSLRKIIADSAPDFQVVGEARNGQEALEQIRLHSPDLIFVDIRMPVMSGLELMERLSQERSETEMIIISGYNDFSYVQQGMKYGAKAYILKPIVPEQVVTALQDVLSRFHEQSQEMYLNSRWMDIYLRAGQSIAEHFWLLEPQRLQELYAQFVEQMQTERLTPRLMKQMNTNLAVIVLESLRERGIDRSELVMPDLKWGTSPAADIRRAMTEWMSGLLDKIRSIRNFGHRKSIEHVVRHIEQNYADESLSLTNLAIEVGVSVSRLSVLFKEEKGIGFTHYLTEKRMMEARKLLEKPQNKASDVALQVGYSDYSHFNKAFRKFCGCTPLEYKKRIGSY